MKNALIILTRAPIPGKTKTRLMTHLTGDECAAIHECFLKDIYENVLKIDVDSFVYYTPERYKNLMCNILGGCQELHPQRGKDLGERMHLAIQDCIEKGYEKCVLIGTDIPTLPAYIIMKAFEKLDNNDIVIGPTLDGGYYLIGMKQPYPQIFMDTFYGVETVFERTLKTLTHLSLGVEILEHWYDVDTFDDLKYLANEIQTKNIHSHHTKQFLTYKGFFDKANKGEDMIYGKNAE